MAEEKLLTVRDVSIILGISEKEVIDLAETGAMPAYKIGGVYLRFRKEQIQEFKRSNRIFSSKGDATKLRYSFSDGFSDFFYYNDFYIVAIVIIVLLLVIIFQGY